MKWSTFGAAIDGAIALDPEDVLDAIEGVLGACGDDESRATNDGVIVKRDEQRVRVRAARVGVDHVVIGQPRKPRLEDEEDGDHG